MIFCSNRSNLRYGNSVKNNRRFRGPALNFSHFLKIIFKVLSKSRNLNQIPMKNEAKWYPTCSCSYSWEQSFEGLDSPWTDSQCIFYLKRIVWLITYLKINGVEQWGFVLWPHFDLKINYICPLELDFHNYLTIIWNFSVLLTKPTFFKARGTAKNRAL